MLTRDQTVTVIASDDGGGITGQACTRLRGLAARR
jgi:hypothetical protein